SVVSGSVPLHYFDPTIQQHPHDMDICVPILRKKRMITFLESISYYAVETGRPQTIHYCDPSAYHSVTTVCNGNKIINIITAQGHISSTPVFYCHLTAVMNLLSADGFFCAYPTLTGGRISLFNKIPYEKQRPSAAAARSWSKYMRQGYIIYRSP
ncbi:hypothetical protein BJ138DRAFT_964440, partial [Hygrophoropsis aurantiaca]